MPPPLIKGEGPWVHEMGHYLSRVPLSLMIFAAVVEMVDTLVLDASATFSLWVRIPPAAPKPTLFSALLAQIKQYI